MRNFLKLTGNVVTLPILHAIHRHPYLWNLNPERVTAPGSPHAQCDDIWVWFNEIDPANPYSAIDNINCVPYPAWHILPELRPVIFDMMKLVGGVQLGRVVISRLKPGGIIPCHTDNGKVAEFYSRYQIALQSYPGVVFTCGDEKINMATGDCWFFDNLKEHSVINNSADDRIALIVDIRNG